MVELTDNRDKELNEVLVNISIDRLFHRIPSDEIKYKKVKLDKSWPRPSELV